MKKVNPDIIKIKVLLLALLLASVTGCAKCGSLPPEAMCGISYGPYPENTMDVSLPRERNGDTPLIILIHGGAWTGGDKGDFSYLRGFLSSRGFAAVSANYRLAGREGTGIREMMDDMENLTAYVIKQAPAWRYSPSKIFFAGHSAGGHIALLYPFTRHRGDSIKGVVSFCGLSDLTDPLQKEYLRRMQIEGAENRGEPFDLIAFVAGPGIENEKRYSPLFNIKAVPVLLFTGREDRIIPWTQSRVLHDEMVSQGLDSTLYVYPDMGHDLTPHYAEIMRITMKWIRAKAGE